VKVAEDRRAVRRIRVALVITKMELGGAQQAALETAKRLDPARFEVLLISGRGGMLDGEASASLGRAFLPTRLIRHPVSPFWDLAAVLWLAGLFLRRRVDLVHTHSSKAGLLGRVAAWLAGVPLVVHTVHGWPFHDFMSPAPRLFFVWLERILASATDVLAAVGESVRRLGLAQGIGRSSQYRILRAGADLEAWKRSTSERRAVRRELGLPAGCRVVGTLANCKPQKAPLDFVRVAVEVQRRFPKTHFVYVGDGPLRPQAEAAAEASGLGGKIHFLGWRQDASRVAACFDLFLLTSRWEGLPCVFQQARAMGLPIVATAVGGAWEAVREGEGGFLCQPGDVPALADRVGLLLADPRLRRAMGRKARASLGREWGFEAMVEATESLYREGCREDLVLDPGASA
jgi:glycosyltransferase involved in cell wall biosynthesis